MTREAFGEQGPEGDTPLVVVNDTAPDPGPVADLTVGEFRTLSVLLVQQGCLLETICHQLTVHGEMLAELTLRQAQRDGDDPVLPMSCDHDHHIGGVHGGRYL